MDWPPLSSRQPLDLFDDGHFNEAVRKAAERFEDAIEKRSDLYSFGRDLMARAFAGPELLNIDRLQPENRDGFVEGYRLLAMGLAGAIRNVFSHGEEEQAVAGGMP